jgi:hypothetical protein
MDPNTNHELATLVRNLEGLTCWYVSSGGAAGSTFQLALGGKIPRSRPLTNPAHPEEYRRFEGEANLLVWCAWRLDGEDRPLTSWDDSSETVSQELGRLAGLRVEAVALARPAWDLALRFSGGLHLQLFADHVPGDPSFDGNWEVWLPQVAAFVGPGAAYVIEPRDRPPAYAPSAQVERATPRPGTTL